MKSREESLKVRTKSPCNRITRLWVTFTICKEVHSTEAPAETRLKGSSRADGLGLSKIREMKEWFYPFMSNFRDRDEPVSGAVKTENRGENSMSGEKGRSRPCKNEGRLTAKVGSQQYPKKSRRRANLFI